MEWLGILEFFVVVGIIVYVDYLSNENTFYQSISYKLLMKIGSILLYSLLTVAFLWFFATFSLRFFRWVVICATRGWVNLNVRLQRYLPNCILPSVFDRTGHPVPNQAYPGPPTAYGDSNNAPVPILPVGPSRVFHHHVHELASNPNPNPPVPTDNPRRRIPRLPACTLQSSRSAASGVVQRTLILQNLEEQMRHVYPTPRRDLQEQNEIIVETPENSPVPRSEPPKTPIDSDCSNNDIMTPVTQFTPVVETESVTNVPILDDKTLVLHQFPRSLTKPCLFCSGLHLETYIRLIEIPCYVVFDCYDLNGPWITYKTEKRCGVIKCMEFLRLMFYANTMVYTVYGERSATAWSLSILIDHLSCVMECWRWEYESAREFATKQPGWGKICEKSSPSMSDIKASFRSKGFCESTPLQIAELISKDLSSITVVIQNNGNRFLLGPTPTEIDCQAFAVLSQMVWGNDRCLRTKISREYLPISQYCIHMRSVLWPDWNDQLATTLQEKSTSQICKIHINASNNEDSFDKLNETNDSEKLLDIAGLNSNMITTPPTNRKFRNSYYQITPTGRTSATAGATRAPREPYSVSEDDEEEEAEILFVRSDDPAKSGTILGDQQYPLNDEGPNRYEIENNCNEEETDPYTRNGMLYTPEEEYIDDNLQDMNH